ncbi:MAG: dephospho-CoA kinase [Woeseia sp.]|jgi:dephospho-CoA kinase|nr:MAG: dephospho-CoA kinase [Woeseia sp.]|tara:strand:- start:3519 stop:4130 length:612 start_codon:yes stop_codon:yes gene_type:complete
MNETFKIGLTGGIASGKTTVCNLFKDLSVEIIDADVISHELSKKGGAAFEEIIEAFEDEIIGNDGELDRKKLRSIVFNDDSKKKMLEGIIHPKVLLSINEKIKASQSDYLIISVPLMIETGMNAMMDRVLLIDCNVETQIERLSQRDQSSREEAIKIIESQASIESKRELSDDRIINNNETSIEELTLKVKELDDFYRNLNHK